MIRIEDFIFGVKKAFEEVESIKTDSLKPESVFREHIAWDSINALIFIAHVNVKYDVVITAEDLVRSKTMEDLYNLVKDRI